MIAHNLAIWRRLWWCRGAFPGGTGSRTEDMERQEGREKKTQLITAPYVKHAQTPMHMPHGHLWDLYRMGSVGVLPLPPSLPIERKHTLCPSIHNSTPTLASTDASSAQTTHIVTYIDVHVEDVTSSAKTNMLELMTKEDEGNHAPVVQQPHS